MPSPWSLSEHQAVLTLGAIRAEINLNRLQSGLAVVDGHDLPSIPTCLGLLIDEGRVPSPPIAECYVRGHDLVAHCASLQQWPIRLELHWRVSPLGADAPAHLDLQISVNTGLLDSGPQLGIVTQGAFAEVLSLAPSTNSSGTPNWRRQSTAAAFPAVDLHGGLLVCRSSGSTPSYIEMIHPTDFCTATIESTIPGMVVVQNVLFRERLEKGVIRRARIRAMLAPRETDVELAHQLYGKFAAEDADLSA